jgi:hypothetical protein
LRPRGIASRRAGRQERSAEDQEKSIKFRKFHGIGPAKWAKRAIQSLGKDESTALRRLQNDESVEVK